MPKFRIGTGGWAYFKIPGINPLLAYSRGFDFVEVNSTFYEIPNIRVIESWRRIVPSDFEFAVRCNRALTHKHEFKPTLESFEILEKMITACNALKAEILHLQTPVSFKPTKENVERIHTLFSSIDVEPIRVALELRASDQSPNQDLFKTMQDLNMVHCVDLSKDQEPAYVSDILYSRLFGKGPYNIYQPTDAELRKIYHKTSKGDYRKAIVSFHSVKMYKDAARFKIFSQTEEFPMVTKSTGLNSLVEILQEDTKFPVSAKEIVRHQGWKLFDVTPTKRVHASYLLKKLPEKTYNSIQDVVNALESLV